MKLCISALDHAKFKLSNNVNLLPIKMFQYQLHSFDMGALPHLEKYYFEIYNKQLCFPTMHEHNL